MLEFIFFIVIVILLFWVGSLSGRITKLERQQRIAAVTSPLVYKPEQEMEQKGFSQPKVLVMQETILDVPQKPVEFITVDNNAKADSPAKEAERAVNWLNRIGVVALVLGIGFFLKIAIDLGWIGPWAQIIIGLGVGGLLIYLAELWKGKFGTRALALSGGGLAILYFCLYAAFNFYHLFPQPVAFIVMVGVSGLAVWLARRYSSLSLGILALFGAYSSPMLFSSGQDQQVFLFVYLTVLNVVALTIMFRKYWMELFFMAFFGTVIDFVIWGANFSTSNNTLVSLSFVIVASFIYILGSAALLRYHFDRKTLPEKFENNIAAFQILAGGFYFISITSLLYVNFHSILPAVALLGAVAVFFSYALVDRLNFRNLNYCMSFVASILLVMAAVWKFDGRALSAVLLLIALLGATVGTLAKREELRVWSIIVLSISLIKSLYDPYGPADTAFLFNAKFGLMFANTLAMLFIGWLYQKVEAVEMEKNVEKALQIGAAFVLWGSLSWDMSATFSGYYSSQNFITLWWVIYPVALAGLAFMSRRKDLGKVALILLAASFFKVLFLPYNGDYVFLYNIKFRLMFLETAALLVVSRLMSKDLEDRSASDILKVVACFLLWFAVSWEITKYFENSFSKNARNLWLSLWWIGYSAVLIGAGIWWKSPLVRKIALALFSITIVKVFLFDLLSLDLGYLIVSFISLGVILISVSFLYRKYKERINQFLEGEEKKI
jgi:uncharacterized membrane protein